MFKIDCETGSFIRDWNEWTKKIIELISYFIPIIFLFVILFLYSNFFWPEEWPKEAQATLAAAITVSSISIFGIYLKFIFDQMSSEAEYNKKISEKMMSKIDFFTETYYSHMMAYARLSAIHLDMIRNNEKASKQENQLVLFYITKYLQYRQKLTIEKGRIFFLQNVDSELCLLKLDVETIKILGFDECEICRLQESIKIEDTYLDFSIKLQNDYELIKIYLNFIKWLKANENKKVEITITYFCCFYELMCYELNLIYMPWYKKKVPQRSNKCKEIQNDNLCKSIDEFLARVDK